MPRITMDVQMPSGLVIPSSLKFSLYRMIQDASISTNILRLIPLNQNSVSGGGLISVRLPLATCSLPSFSMSFNNTITQPNFSNPDSAQFPYSGTYPGTTFPQGLEGLIQRLEIVVAGVSLMTLPNYNMLYQVLKDINQTFDHKLSRHIVEGEDDVQPIVQITGNGVTSIGAEAFTGYQWTATASTNKMTVRFTTMNPPENGSVVYNAPPSSFFGFTATSALSVYPTITAVLPSFINAEGTYNNGTGYTVAMEYALASAQTWSGTSSTAIQSVPFTAIAVQTGLTFGTDSGFTSMYPCNSQFNTIRDFLGFFKAMPKSIQLAALGEVEIRIYLEQPQNVLVVPAPAQSLAQFSSANAPSTQISSGQYTLNNIEFQIRTMSWDNGWLDSMLQAQLAEGNTLEIPYPNYYSVVQAGQPAGATTTRFSVNTQNLRQVWGINKPALQGVLNTQQLMFPAGFGVNSYNKLDTVYKGSFFATTASNPSVFSSSLNNGAFSDKSNYILTPQPNRYQYLINNQLIPNLQVPPTRNYAFTQEILGKDSWDCGTAVGTSMNYMSFCYAMGISLEYIDKYCDASVRELFGLDTRSASSVFYLNQTNNNAGDTTIIFSIFTSVLRVAMNNQIQVII